MARGEVGKWVVRKKVVGQKAHATGEERATTDCAQTWCRSKAMENNGET